MPPSDNSPCIFPRDNCPQDNSSRDNYPLDHCPLDNYPQLPLHNYLLGDCPQTIPRYCPLRTIAPRTIPPRHLSPDNSALHNCPRMFIPSYAYKEISLLLFPKWLFLLTFRIRGLCQLRYFSSKYPQSITHLNASGPDSLPNPSLTLKPSTLHAT